MFLLGLVEVYENSDLNWIKFIYALNFNGCEIFGVKNTFNPSFWGEMYEIWIDSVNQKYDQVEYSF